MSGSGNESVLDAVMLGASGAAASTGDVAADRDDFGAAEAAGASGASGLRTNKEMISKATRVVVQEWWSANVVLII